MRVKDVDGFGVSSRLSLSAYNEKWTFGVIGRDKRAFADTISAVVESRRR